MPKTRLDILVTERGLAPSRERAKAIIMEGLVFVNGIREDKPGTGFDPDRIKSLEVRGETLNYVSRGGLKLEKALRVFGIDPSDRICLDVGASTGGFTDVLLQNGARRVYAVDSGTNQLAWKLRSDPRVVSMEKTNFRYMTRDDMPESVSLVTIDASFISLTRLIPPARELMLPAGEMVCLIKPQFEAGRDKVGKHGVVRDSGVHREVIKSITGFAAETGFIVQGLDFSPITGPEGNIEYLLYLTKRDGGQDTECDHGTDALIDEVVAASHEVLQG